MARSRKKKEPEGITPEFKDDVTKMTSDQMKIKVFNMQAEAMKTQDFLKNNPGVVDAKNAYDLAAGPARDTMRVLKNRTKYIIDEMNKSGMV
jgi:hypothetical protein